VVPSGYESPWALVPGCHGEEKSLLLLLPDIRVKFSCRPALSLVTILTELFRLLIEFVNNQVMNDEMGGACNTNGGDEECI
jgi:hypothetical protein